MTRPLTLKAGDGVTSVRCIPPDENYTDIGYNVTVPLGATGEVISISERKREPGNDNPGASWCSLFVEWDLPKGYRWNRCWCSRGQLRKLPEKVVE